MLQRCPKIKTRPHFSFWFCYIRLWTMLCIQSPNKLVWLCNYDLPFLQGIFEISTKIMFSVWNMVESLKNGFYCRKIATTYWVSKLLGNFLQLMLHQPREELAKTKFNKGVNWSNTIIHFSHQCKIFLNFFAKHDKSAKNATFSKTVLTGNFYKFLWQGINALKMWS